MNAVGVRTSLGSGGSRTRPPAGAHTPGLWDAAPATASDTRVAHAALGRFGEVGRRLAAHLRRVRLRKPTSLGRQHLSRLRPIRRALPARGSLPDTSLACAAPAGRQHERGGEQAQDGDAGPLADRREPRRGRDGRHRAADARDPGRPSAAGEGHAPSQRQGGVLQGDDAPDGRHAQRRGDGQGGRGRGTAAGFGSAGGDLDLTANRSPRPRAFPRSKM